MVVVEENHHSKAPWWWLLIYEDGLVWQSQDQLENSS
jgi:hypothetical protein